MNEAPRADEGEIAAAAICRDAEQMLLLLVGHLREHHTRLQQEWVTRIHNAHLLDAISTQERDLETTYVYDNYACVLETGSVEAMQQFTRDLAERFIPRGVQTKDVLGIVLQLYDVVARSLFKKYQPDFGLLNRVLDAYEPVANRIANAVAFTFTDEQVCDPSAAGLEPGTVGAGAAGSHAGPDPVRHSPAHPPDMTTAQADADLRNVLAGARAEITTLNEALRTRTTIGEAVGLLMHERTLTADAAFAHLVEVSSHTNTKIREIAALMVEEADVRAERAGAACSMQSRRVGPKT